jgi:hypothetical protein
MCESQRPGETWEQYCRRVNSLENLPTWEQLQAQVSALTDEEINAIEFTPVNRPRPKPANPTDRQS